MTDVHEGFFLLFPRGPEPRGSPRPPKGKLKPRKNRRHCGPGPSPPGPKNFATGWAPGRLFVQPFSLHRIGQPAHLWGKKEPQIAVPGWECPKGVRMNHRPGRLVFVFIVMPVCRARRPRRVCCLSQNNSCGEKARPGKGEKMVFFVEHG